MENWGAIEKMGHQGKVEKYREKDQIVEIETNGEIKENAENRAMGQVQKIAKIPGGG